jgi:hypothetical protein
MKIRRQAEVAGNREEHEGVLGVEPSPVHQESRRFLAGHAQRVVDVVR